MLELEQWSICAILTLLVFTYWRYRTAVSMVSNFPGLRLLISPMSAIGVFLPALPYPLVTYPGFSFPWTLKYKGLFEKLKCDTVSICGVDGRAMLFTADVSFINYMTAYGSRDIFPKPVDEYKVLSYLGSNLVICEGESWRRQRRIGAPAFSKRMFERLWLDMRDIVREMVEEERWMDRTSLDNKPDLTVTQSGYVLQPGELLVPQVVDLTLRMALAAIARAGFGMDFEWEPEASFTRGCQEFGNPQRWSWWLALLSWIWGVVDFVVVPLHHLYGPLLMSFPWSIFYPITVIWNSIPLAPLRWTWNLVSYFLAEFWTIFSRPTDADFQPRQIKVHEALHLVAKDSILRMATPTWMMHLPFRRMRRMQLAFSTLKMELKRLTEERKAFHLQKSLDQEELADRPLKDNRSDLLNNLVKAAIMDDGDLEKGQTAGLVTGGIQRGLTDDEIIGNTYIYFLAGHETTAHTLAWTLALLAAYPEHQNAAFEEISNVWPSSSVSYDPFHTDTTMDDYAKFPFLLACFWETVRLFPPVQMIPKVAAQDTSVSVETSNVAEMDSKGGNSEFGRTTFVVKKGTIIFLHPTGVHYNPRYWKDPEVFDPNRFLRPYNKDAFIPFGVAQRSCLGRKFSECEAVAMLAHLLRNYSVHLVPTSADGSVDVPTARERFSQASPGITLTPVDIPLIFRRRVHS